MTELRVIADIPPTPEVGSYEAFSASAWTLNYGRDGPEAAISLAAVIHASSAMLLALAPASQGRRGSKHAPVATGRRYRVCRQTRR